MKFRKLIWLAGTTLLVVLLSACNLGATPAPAEDPGAIQTQAFSIVSTQAAVQQAQTEQALPPTSLPTNTPFSTPTLGGFPTFAPVGTTLAFNTQQPGSTPLSTVGVVSTFTTKNGCNDGAFMAETEPFDKTVIAAGKEFSKGWSIQNTGTCAWDEGYSFAYLKELSSPELNGDSIVLKKSAPDEYTQPGYGQTYILKLTAPKDPGEYKGYWKLKDDTGNYFGPLVSVWIIVE